MSKHYTMKKPRIEVEFRSSEEATAKGGVFAVKAFAEECGLWDRGKSESALGVRNRSFAGAMAKSTVRSMAGCAISPRAAKSPSCLPCPTISWRTVLALCLYLL